MLVSGYMIGGREFFTGTVEAETPEQKERRMRYEEGAKKKLGWEEKDPKLAEILDKVDFDILRGILERHAIHSGVPKGQMNFVGKDRIKHSASIFALGTYYLEENIIGLERKDIEKKYEGMDLALAIVLCLSHEEVHAASRIECHGYYDELKEEEHRTRHREIGYWKEDTFNAFNEAVTEKLGREVFEEYIRATAAVRGSELRSFLMQHSARKKSEEHQYKVPCQEEVEFLEYVIEEIHHATNLPEKTIWEAFIRGLFVGEKFQDKEIQAGFAEIFGEDFLKQMEGRYGLPKFSKRPFTLPPWGKGGGNIRGQIKTWFQKFSA